MNPTEPVSSERLRQVTWPIWLSWVLVSALGPVFSTISVTAFGKEIAPNVEYRSLIMTGLVALAAFLIVAPPIMQGLVLKRIVPKLNVWIWFFCILLSGIAWFVLMMGQHRPGPGLLRAGYQAQFQLESAASPQRLAGTLNATQMLALPWGPFLLWTIANSALTSLLPACALGFASRRWRAVLLFVAAATLGAVAAAVVEQLHQMMLGHFPLKGRGLNGWDWARRFQELAICAGIGAVWGATAATFVVLMTRRFAAARAPNARVFAIHRVGGLALVFIAPSLIAVLAPFAGYLAGPRGLVAGTPELRNASSLALSRAPSQDISQGETTLLYSHDIAIAVAPRSAPVIAPDGASAIVRTLDHTLIQVDLASGRPVRQLAGALAPLETYAIAWSPDGRYLALRSSGEEVTVPNTHHRKHQTRVRLYALPEFELTGEFSNSEGTCFDFYALELMLFSNDSKSLWLLCDQYAAKPDDLMAIGFDVPAMQMHGVRYGESAALDRTGGIERIGDSVWAWQYATDATSFRIRDLTRQREIVNVAVPLGQVGALTAQRRLTHVDEKVIRLVFCGAPPGAPTGAAPVSFICRTLTFDTQTGELIGSVDGGTYDVLNPWRGPIRPGMPQPTLWSQALRIESSWRQDSKRGEIVVRDRTTGRERQRIVSIAQWPLQMSADGNWLITVAVNGGGLRLYRIHM